MISPRPSEGVIVHQPQLPNPESVPTEANVKADKADGVTPEILAKRTIEHIKERHHAEDSTVGVEATYEKEEVDGPLKQAFSKVKEKVTSSS